MQHIDEFHNYLKNLIPDVPYGFDEEEVIFKLIKIIFFWINFKLEYFFVNQLSKTFLRCKYKDGVALFESDLISTLIII